MGHSSQTSAQSFFSCRVPLKADGAPLVSYLAERFTYYKEDDWSRLVEAEQILLNGEISLSQTAIHAGDEIRYFTQQRPEPKVPLKIHVVYEDQDLLVVNKPAHLPVHPSGKYLRNTLINVLKKQKQTEKLFLAHRIDRETSGLCVLTKSTLAKEKMYWTFFEGRVDKSYWALAWGIPSPPAGLIDVPIGTVPKGSSLLSKIRIKQVIGGAASKRAQTKYRLLQTNWIRGLWLPPPWAGLERQAAEIAAKKAFPVSLIECKPITGRTNQIRVHMAHLGCGLVGDKLYDPSEEIFIELSGGKPLLEDEEGDAGFRIPAHLRPRLVLDAHALHAHSLKFRHPRTGEGLNLFAPPPKTWQGLYRS